MGRFEDLEAGALRCRQYVADGEDGRPGVIVLHPWWGLNGDVLAYVDRLAAAGFTVVAPDLFHGRVATTVEEAERLAQEAEQAEEELEAISLAATDGLIARLGTRHPVGTLGFSFGAGWALWLGAERPAVGASVVYYGTMLGPSLARSSAPVLGHFAADDPFEPAENVDAFERALRDAGRSVEIHRYPGTGHWFCEPSQDAFRSAEAELALERTIAFLGRTLGTSIA
jgi:carboxymethylenebutenolidase